MAKTTELVESLRCTITPGGPADDKACENCAYGLREEFGGEELWSCDCERMVADAAARIEALTDRCARYAEEIAVLQEKQRWVDAGARQPEYGVPVLAVASGKAGNITLCDAVVFATFYDGWELDDYPQAEDVTVKWWQPIAESPEGVSGGMEHE